MTPPLDEIQELARQVIDSEGLELIDVEYKVGRTRSLLRIFIDKSGGVTLEDCETVSRQLSAILDVKDLVKNSYVLEVSSPGVDRPLVTDKDYRRSLGRTVRVRYYTESGETTDDIGVLQEADEESITIESGGVTKRILRSQIKRVNQEIILGHPKKKRKRHR